MFSSLTKFKLVMFALLSFFILTHNSSKQIKETLIIFENWGGLWNIPWTEYKKTSPQLSEYEPKLTAHDIWELEVEYFLANYRLDKKQGKIILSWLKKTYPEAPYMLYVARCESDELVHWENLHTLELLKRKNGSDRGVLQVNGVHEEDIKRMGLNLKKIDDYFAFSRYLYDKKGVQPWYMSKHCWGKHYRRIKKSYNI